MAGYPPLLSKIALLVQSSYGRTSNPDTEILAAGATQAIFATIQALVDTDDEVIILDPSYDCYEAPVLLCAKPPFVLRLMMTIPPIGKDRKSMFL
jgi:methionine aminotransferase